MSKQCLFCAQTVSSSEHVWSDWILEEIRSASRIRIRIGKHVDVWKADPEITVKCVCRQCNNTWMSDLENENRPHVRSMIQNLPTTLEPSVQRVLARWAVLKAMVIEAANRKRLFFYGEADRKGIKPPSSFIPIGTFVWIGKLSTKQFHAGGTDIWGEIDGAPRAFHGCVTTVVVGHLVIQVLTMHAPVPFIKYPMIQPECKPGRWDETLFNIWPVYASVKWPPARPFALRGENSIGTLVNRWKIGIDVG
jgi:hypothetical protein